MVLVLLIFAVLACYFTVMFNLQIVHGAEYRSQSVSQIVRTTTVEAARGNITDRNGNLIVGNQQTYTLTFDASLLPDDADTNEAILRLVNLCIENNVSITDNVPPERRRTFHLHALPQQHRGIQLQAVSRKRPCSPGWKRKSKNTAMNWPQPRTIPKTR